VGKDALITDVNVLDLSRAVEAATTIAHRLGDGDINASILQASRHVSIHLSPMNVVARVFPVEDERGNERCDRELAVARHLVRKAAPVVAPVNELPAGPHLYEEFAVTLWEHVDHAEADGDNADHVSKAAHALHRIHDALADFAGHLPRLGSKLEGCRRLLENQYTLRALQPDDRVFLLMTHDRLLADMSALPARQAPIHGDAGLHNVFITPRGAIFADFEDACLGPREWDIGWVPDAELACFEPVDHRLLSVLRDLRRLCVSVWCWDEYELPWKREAAAYHLGYLKCRFA
jgi:Ser/Thr protein kinase RdoA (MazF antagonist)